MDIELNLFGPYRDAAGSETLEVTVNADTTVRGLFRELNDEYPELTAKVLNEDGELSGSVTLTKNGQDVKLIDGGDTSVEDGDVFRAAPPVHGG